MLSAPSKGFLSPGILLTQVSGVPGSLCRAMRAAHLLSLNARHLQNGFPS